MYTTSDFKDIGIRKSEFVARTHFFCLDSFWGEGTVFYPLWWHVTRDNASIFHEFFKYVSFRSVYKRNSLFLAENPCSKLGRIKIINVLYLQRLPTKNEQLEGEVEERIRSDWKKNEQGINEHQLEALVLEPINMNPPSPTFRL